MSLTQPTGDFPQILTSNYGAISAMPIGGWCAPEVEPDPDWHNELRQIIESSNQQAQEIMANNSTRRIVQVFIADPDINVPLDAALLYKSEPKFTDATDQELYFEVPIVTLLEAHNSKRKTWLDKDASRKAGKDVLLDPAKIRDLKMVVVNIAQF